MKLMASSPSHHSESIHIIINQKRSPLQPRGSRTCAEVKEVPPPPVHQRIFFVADFTSA